MPKRILIAERAIGLEKPTNGERAGGEGIIGGFATLEAEMIAYALLGLALACVSIFMVLGLSIGAFYVMRRLGLWEYPQPPRDEDRKRGDGR